MGGGNSAGQAAVHLAKHASKVTVLVRSQTLAESMSDYLITLIEMRWVGFLAGVWSGAGRTAPTQPEEFKVVGHI